VGVFSDFKQKNRITTLHFQNRENVCYGIVFGLRPASELNEILSILRRMMLWGMILRMPGYSPTLL
jgi:hypothetical protein